MKAVSVQWRVATKHPRYDEPMTQNFAAEHDARDWARLERIDYPHCEVYIERREVTPWERVA